MKRTLFLIVLSGWVLSACVGLNVALLPSSKPLEEKVLEGDGKAKILLVDLDGTISFKEESDPLKLAVRPSKVAFFREALRKAEGDPDLAGVIVKINSPGGTVTASDTIYHEILKFKEKKRVPVVAYILEVGASGGYYVASAADRIVASPTAVTGSIGVIAVRLNLEGLLSKVGVSGETYKSGAMKDFWSPLRPSTEEERGMIQKMISRLYGRFFEVVYASRQKMLTEAELKTLADGRIFTAGEALDAKLIDEVAYLDSAIESMKAARNLDRARVVTYVRPRTYKSNIYSEYPELPLGPQTINLISLNAEELSLFSGLRFMYLWAP
jgi:protease-4